jgi:hypothetical protein
MSYPPAGSWFNLREIAANEIPETIVISHPPYMAGDPYDPGE